MGKSTLSSDYENSMINMQQKAANIAACVKPTARGKGGQLKWHTDLHHGVLCAADPARSAPTGRAAFSSSGVFRTHKTRKYGGGERGLEGPRFACSATVATLPVERMTSTQGYSPPRWVSPGSLSGPGQSVFYTKLHGAKGQRTTLEALFWQGE